MNESYTTNMGGSKAQLLILLLSGKSKTEKTEAHSSANADFILFFVILSFISLFMHSHGHY